MATTLSLVDRLDADHSSFARIPSLARAFDYLERALSDGGGQLGAASVDCASAPPATDVLMAINALRTSGAMELVARYPLSSPYAPALTVGEPKSAWLIGLAARGLLTPQATQAIEMHYVLKEPVAAPPPEQAEFLSRNHGGEFTQAALEGVLKNLSAYTLDPGNNEVSYGGFGTYSFRGNFFRISAAFSVTTNDPFVALTLMAAMDANRARPEYVDDVAFRERAAVEHESLLRTAGDERALSNARQEWAATRPPRAGEVKGLEQSKRELELAAGAAASSGSPSRQRATRRPR